jgi:hypothetical protein
MSILPRDFRIEPPKPQVAKVAPVVQPAVLPERGTTPPTTRPKVKKRRTGRKKIYNKGTRERLTICAPRNLLHAVESFCESQELSYSAYMTTLMERDMRARGWKG